MATLTATALAKMRQECARSVTVNYTKPQINAALQAIEDAMTTQAIPAGAVGATMPQYIGARIDSATSPLVLTNPQKKALFAWWAEHKFNTDK